MRKSFVFLSLLFLSLQNVCGDDFSHTLPVIYIHTVDNQPITSKYDYIEGTNIMRDYCTFEEGYSYEIYDDLFNYKYCVECTFNGEFRYSTESGEEKTITEEEFNKLSYKNSKYKHLRNVANKSKEEIINILENK